MSEIQGFLLGQEPDYRGRSWQEIISLDDKWWDECHDFIQWLFPLPVESKHAAYSPVLTEQDLTDLWENKTVQYNLLTFSKRFCKFLGIDILDIYCNHVRMGFNSINESDIASVRFRVSQSHSFSSQAKYWLKANDHNHLRINRMLQCLVLFGLENLAKEIFRCLVMIKCEFPDCITDETMVYWRNALTGYSY